MGLNLGGDLMQKLMPGVTRRAAESAVEESTAKAADTAARTLSRDSLSLSKEASSVLHFDATNPKVQQAIEDLGWKRPGLQSTLESRDTFAHVSTDHWQTSQDIPLQYLIDNRQGFLLRGVEPGTPVEFAVHADIGVSHNQFYSLDDRNERWLNNWGENFQATTEKNGF